MKGVLHVAEGPSGEDVPPVFIDRAGAKVGLIEQHSRNSKASLSFVAEQVSRWEASAQLFDPPVISVCMHLTPADA